MKKIVSFIVSFIIVFTLVHTSGSIKVLANEVNNFIYVSKEKKDEKLIQKNEFYDLIKPSYEKEKMIQEHNENTYQENFFDNQRIISGTVSLPNGESAPEGGIQITIEIVNIIDNSYWMDWITIGEGEKSVDYSVYVSSESADGEFVVTYHLYGLYDMVNNYLKGIYKKEGFYNVNGTTIESDSASKLLLNNGDKQNINMTILYKDLVDTEVKLLLENKDMIPDVHELIIKNNDGFYTQLSDLFYDDEYELEEIAVITERQAGGYSLTIKGLDWNIHEEYQLLIKNGDYLLNKTLISSDNGKTIEVKADSFYTKINVNSKDISESIDVSYIQIQKDINGTTVYNLDIEEGIYILQGNYGIQVYGEENNSSYALLKENYLLSNDNEIIFTKDEIAKVTLAVNNYTGKGIYVDGIIPVYFDITLHYNINDAREVYLSKCVYRNLMLEITTSDEYTYLYTLNNSVIDCDTTISLDTNLKANIDLEDSEFVPRRYKSFYYNDLFISDSFNNRIRAISNMGSYEKFKLKLESRIEIYEFDLGPWAQ